MGPLELPDQRFYPLPPEEFLRLPGHAGQIHLPLAQLGTLNGPEAYHVAEMFLRMTRHCGLWTGVLVDALRVRAMTAEGVRVVSRGIEQLVQHSYLVQRRPLEDPKHADLVYCFPTVVLAQVAIKANSVS